MSFGTPTDPLLFPCICGAVVQQWACKSETAPEILLHLQHGENPEACREWPLGVILRNVERYPVMRWVHDVHRYEGYQGPEHWRDGDRIYDDCCGGRSKERG